MSKATLYKSRWLRSIHFDASKQQHLICQNSYIAEGATELTIEALCTLEDPRGSPTLICQTSDAGSLGESIAWRLGFSEDSGVPEFQVALAGTSAMTTVRAGAPVRSGEWTHLAGVFDGRRLRLYVDGSLNADVDCAGAISGTSSRAAIGARGPNLQEGFYSGGLHELRVWRVARTAEQIDAFKARKLFNSLEEGMISLYTARPAFPLAEMVRAREHGFSELEIAFLDHLGEYHQDFSVGLQGIDSVVSAPKYTVVFVPACDGYLVFHEPNLPSYVAEPLPDMKGGGVVWLASYRKWSVAEIIGGLTANRLKVVHEDGSVLPDNPDAVGWMLSPDLGAQKGLSPRFHLMPLEERTDSALPRLRMTSPRLAGAANSPTAFTWFAVDIWSGQPGWEIAEVGLASLMAAVDKSVFAIVGPLQIQALGTPRDPLEVIDSILQEFEQLLAGPDVDEVRDVLPFLKQRRHWILLHPSCEQVWPEKTLGSKLRVDFVIRDHDGEYTVMEIESPLKRVFKAGKLVDPLAEYTHAEQQVRDYCNFVDENLDYVRRVEGLEDIRSPRGVVVIGRRRDLSEAAKKKLSERNKENARYRTLTFDDLIEQTRAFVERARESLKETFGHSADTSRPRS